MLYIRDLNSKNIIQRIDCYNDLKLTNSRKLTLLPNSDILLYESTDSIIVGLNIKSKEIQFSIPNKNKHLFSNNVTSDGNYIIFCYSDANVEIFNTNNHKTKTCKISGTSAVTFINNNPNHWILAPESGGDSGCFIVVNDGKQTRIEKDFSFLYRHIVHCPSKDILICTSDDEVHFVSRVTYEVILAFKAFEDVIDYPPNLLTDIPCEISCICFVDDDHFLCASNFGQIKLFNIEIVEKCIYEESQRTFMTKWEKPNVERIFLFGAGASVYAGFPLGKSLIDFVLRSKSPDKKQYDIGDESNGIAWLLAYIVTSSEPCKLLDDPEKALSDLVTMYYGNKTFPQLGTEDLFLDYRYLSHCQLPIKVKRYSSLKSYYIEGSLPVEDEKRIKRYKEYLPKWLSLSNNKKKELLTSFSKKNNTSWYDIDLTIKVMNEKHLEFFSLQSLINAYMPAFIYHQRILRYTIKEGYESEYAKQIFKTKIDFDRFIDTVHGISQYFKEGDVIVTFNWDSFLEYVLSLYNLVNIPAVYGIGIAWDQEYLNVKKNCINKSPIYILKPHGSTSWMRYEEDTIRVKRNFNKKAEIYCNNLDNLFGWKIHSTFYPYDLEEYNTYDYEEKQLFAGSEPDYDDNFRTFQIMSPFYLKDYKRIPILNEIWNNTAQLLQEASEIYICGYSLPESDHHALDLIRSALSKNKECKIKIISKEPQESWLNLLKDINKKPESGGNFWFDKWMCKNRDF